MPYGTVEFTQQDINLVVRRLESRAVAVKLAANEGTSDDERRFYTAAGEELAAWTDRLMSGSPGRWGFSEDELRYLRGSISENPPSELARQIVEAKQVASPHLAELELEYAHLHALRERLERPFLEDTSQDPEDEE